MNVRDLARLPLVYAYPALRTLCLGSSSESLSEGHPKEQLWSEIIRERVSQLRVKRQSSRVIETPIG